MLGIEFENRLQFPVEFGSREHSTATALYVGSAPEHDSKREPRSHIVGEAVARRTCMGLGPFEDIFPSITIVRCPGCLDKNPYGVGHAVDNPCGTLVHRDSLLRRERAQGGDQHENRPECLRQPHYADSCIAASALLNMFLCQRYHSL